MFTDFSKSKNYMFFPILLFLFIVFYFFIIQLTTSKLDIKNGCNTSYAKFIKHEPNGSKLTFCDKWNKNKIKLYSDSISDEKYIAFDYIGFPNDENISLYLEDKIGNIFEIEKLKDNSERWRTVSFEIPNTLSVPIHLVAEDSSDSTYGWIGIGNIKVTSSLETFDIPFYLQTLGFIFIFSLLISIVFGSYLKKNTPLNAYVYMALFVGLAALLAFNAYIIALWLGYIVSIFILLCLVKMGIDTWQTATNYPHVGFIFLSMFSMLSIIFFLAYSDFGNLSHIAQISANKWHHLPVDNWIPKIFADAILRENIPNPLVGDWLSSDRPPLQVGLFLIFGSLWSSDLLYLVVSVGVQLLVIIFVVLLLKEYVKEYTYVLLAGILIFFNGFVFVNGLFVWPKLFSALYQGIAFYYVYKIWQSNGTVKTEYILFGVSAVLAFLAHGGSVFYLLSLSILLLFTLTNKERLRYLFYGFITAVILYIPWVIYQKIINPPGDRLLKWHLTDQHQITDEPFLTVFFNYYSNLSLTQWFELRLAHINRIFHSLYGDISNITNISNNKFLDNIFFSVEYSYMFFSTFFLLFYWYVKYPRAEIRKFSGLLFASFILYILLWVLLLVSGTVIHQGAHFGWFSGFITITLITYFLNRFLFYILALLNLGMFVKVYIVGYCCKEDIFSSGIFLLMAIIFVLNLKLYLTKYIK